MNKKVLICITSAVLIMGIGTISAFALNSESNFSQENYTNYNCSVNCNENGCQTNENCRQECRNNEEHNCNNFNSCNLNRNHCRNRKSCCEKN